MPSSPQTASSYAAPLPYGPTEATACCYCFRGCSRVNLISSTGYGQCGCGHVVCGGCLETTLSLATGF
ncbi:hypothetical protein K440DRAFT_625636 [Wilcoxina mikolae CBS 423.85]|nr:hypothetical protein K440DRAFT_625636 [Wilcoxina mikolae CBS 423.85]